MSSSPYFPPVSVKILRLALQALGALLLTLFVAVVSAPAQAQVRAIPATAKLATLKLGIFPEAELDGKPVRLGPGARIYNQNNTIVIPASLKGTSLVIAYTTGSIGEIVNVWILKDAEIEQIRARSKRSG